MEHAKGMCAITNPLVNSYKRIVSGFDAPKNVVWTRKHENALLKVRTRLGEDTKIELRFPDPSANVYLALALCIAAGLDGLEKQTNPGEEGVVTDSLPGTLREAIGFVQEDAFIAEVLGKEFVQIYTNAKLQEWEEYMNRVSDWEVNKYLNRI